jgi:hypothetical protein
MELQKTCPKHVNFYSKNKFEKLVHLVDFIVRIRIKRFMQVDYGLMLLVPRLRMGGALPMLPLYAFVAWTGETLPFFLARGF